MPNSKRKTFTLTEAKAIGDKLGLNWEQFDVKQFRMGMNAELADGTYNIYTSFGGDDDPIKLGKVVRAHLHESPEYYSEWEQKEKEAKRRHEPKPTMSSVEATGIIT